MMPLLSIQGKEYSVAMHSNLRHCVEESGLLFPCGGYGLCGQCKVCVQGEVSDLTEEEQRLLTEDERAQGVRLACMTYVMGDCSVTIPEHRQVEICTDFNVFACNVYREFHYGVAIDVGTTTVAAALYRGDGVLLGKSSAVNPQTLVGDDVLTRVQAAVSGESRRIADLIRGCITEMVCGLTERAAVPMKQIDGVVITGNTAMLCLLTETTVEHLATAPFYSERKFGETILPNQCGLEGIATNAYVYLPYCADAFLGADLLCALLNVDMSDKSKTFFLIDVGTNGEMALYHKGSLYLCSTAAGPAFEGVGISCGMIAEEGAIDRVDAINDALITHTIGNVAPRGICGSGLIDGVACLLDLGEVNQVGYMDGGVYAFSDQVKLTVDDVQAILIAKSAIRSGIDTLLHTAGLSASEIDSFYLAGGFGNRLRNSNAARIGMIPNGLASRTVVMGNGALAGAVRVLFGDYNADTIELVENARIVQLATDDYFGEAFMRNMKL